MRPPSVVVPLRPLPDRLPGEPTAADLGRLCPWCESVWSRGPCAECRADARRRRLDGRDPWGVS